MPPLFGNWPSSRSSFPTLMQRFKLWTISRLKSLLAGESIGFVGPSGCGKTTLVDALLGLLEPQKGRVLYNGKPFYETLGEWHRQVAYLPQEVFLVDDSLRNNIALGVDHSNIDENRLMEAIRQARMNDFLKDIPEGLDTMLGERGVRLSGGQRQRIALARAFYHQREILVLDESTSALDLDTERLIVDEIKRLKGQKTLIIIAHRLSTLAHCDKVYELDGGRIINFGSYDDFMVGKNG